MIEISLQSFCNDQNCQISKEMKGNYSYNMFLYNESNDRNYNFMTYIFDESAKM